MSERNARWFGVNMLLLVVALFPIWFLVLGSWVVRTRGSQGGNYVLAAVFYFLMMAVPLLLGGAAQQVVLYFLPRTWDRRVRRLGAVAAGMVMIPAAFLLMQSEPRFVLAPQFLVSLLAALAVYCMLIRLPQ